MGVIDRYVIDNDLVLLPNRTMYIKSIRALVVADLHLGIEYAMALKGIYLPAYQFAEIREILFNYISRFRPEKLIVVGDFKHEFAQKTWQEHRETLLLLDEIKNRNLYFILVRGNHDNFIRGILERNNVDFRDPYYVEGEFLFIHGHKDIPGNLDLSPIRYIIMAHEHPAVLFKDEVGGRDKVPVFMIGSFPDNKKIKLIVLPALSSVASGIEVNFVAPSDFLSPILQRAEIDEFKAIASLSTGLLELPQIKHLRSLL
ncbi:MAG: hypothetical protein DRZ80_08010 [Thermoprotei archaeon]|nr:MAG: hypothetical protein DRZ80_08010 [Thermoprotei archaeon]